jgi:hypothetical protein
MPTRGGATNRVWTGHFRLTEMRRDARIYGAPLRDIYYKILCLV